MSAGWVRHSAGMPDATGFFSKLTSWFDGDSSPAPSPEPGVADDFGEDVNQPEITEPTHGSIFQTDPGHGFVQADGYGSEHQGGTFLADPPQGPIDYHDGPIEAPGGGPGPAPEAPLDVGDGPVELPPEGVPDPVLGSYQPDLTSGYSPVDLSTELPFVPESSATSTDLGPGVDDGFDDFA